MFCRCLNTKIDELTGIESNPDVKPVFRHLALWEAGEENLADLEKINDLPNANQLTIGFGVVSSYLELFLGIHHEPQSDLAQGRGREPETLGSLGMEATAAKRVGALELSALPLLLLLFLSCNLD